MNDLRSKCALLLVLIATIGGECKQATSQAADSAKEGGAPSAQQSSCANRPAANQGLADLVRKYSATVELGATGKVQMIWLTPELLDALMDEHARRTGSSPAQTDFLRRKLEHKLDSQQSMAFLAIFRPALDAYLSQPKWKNDGNSDYPAIFLRGSGNRLQRPYKWDQIIGEGQSRWYSNVTWGYVLYHSRDDSGRSVVAEDEFSFSIIMQNTAESANGTVYDASTEFNYNLMPVPLQNLADSSLPSSNQSLANLYERVPHRANDSTIEHTGDTIATEGSATQISLGDIEAIISLGLHFVELIVK
jgi:hypothetical protein